MFFSLGLDCNMILGAQWLWNEYREIVLHLSNAKSIPTHQTDKSPDLQISHISLGTALLP